MGSVVSLSVHVVECQRTQRKAAPRGNITTERRKMAARPKKKEVAAVLTIT